MWQRMRRVFRSMFGWMISAAEDPELILEQNIRDLNDQVPKMNESIAMVKANQTLLEKENQKYKNDVTELTSKVKAAIQAGRDDIAVPPWLDRLMHFDPMRVLFAHDNAVWEPA